MIEQITARFFRKHQELSISFASGLNVIRGPNECGKTTAQEIILYALYGAKALRNPVSETVTWGQKENDLFASVTLSISGVSYVFTRSPKGAECNYAGGKVTGQSEVTKFAGDLLGADAKTASVLMMASQSDLRGVLSEGPTAVSSLMGKLADFDLIDRILNAAASKLLLGAEEPIKVKLAAAQADVDLATASLVDPAVAEGLRLQIAIQNGELANAEAVSENVLQPELITAEQAVAHARQHNGSHRAAVLALEDVVRRRTGEMAKLEAAERDAAKKPDAARISALRAELLDLNAARTRLTAYNHFLEMPRYPDVAWDQDHASFEAEVKAVAARHADATVKIAGTTGEIRQIEAGRITNGKCPTCGSIKIDDAHVAAKNAEVDAALAVKTKELAAHRAAQADAKVDMAALAGVDAIGKKIAAHLTKISTFVEIDASTYPVKACWGGEVPAAVDSGTRAAELATLEKADREADQAQGRVIAHRAALVDLVDAQVRAEGIVAALPPIHEGPLAAAYDEAYRRYTNQANVIREIRAQLDTAQRNLRDVEATMALMKSKLEAATARVAECEADLKKLAFNNTLVKKVKLLKPAITDFLWSSVLSAVSNFFSTMRGEQSVVTKNDEGFKVNGKPVDSLSGSTLDALALAIRVALSKTFVPHASFMMLDEPAHGADNDRTANILGFLATANFDQTILASHDPLSENVASNVINLGG